MKVAHVIAGLNDGGAEAVLYRLCANSLKHTHIVVSLMDVGKYGALLSDLGVRVYCLNMPRGRVTFGGLIRLRRILRDEKPSAMQTWMFHADLIGGLVGRLSGIRNITWGVHSSSLDINKTSKTTILVAKLCTILSHWLPKTIVYCAEESRRVYQKLGFDESKGVVIPNGYDVSEFYPDAVLANKVKMELGLVEEIAIIGMVARYDPQKDHYNLISALNYLNKTGVEFICLLVGSGMVGENEELLRWIAENGVADQVRLLGMRDDVPAIMNVLDLHVLSSSYGEAFPNVLCEAMACGTACVATDVGDSGVIVSETGWVVPPEEAKKLALAIEEALNKKRGDKHAWNLREQLCRSRIVDNFGVEVMVGRYSDIWGDSN
ncbi:MAG: glycosyl transferase family 1 [Alteromonas sp. Nap_26]|nr:MAG: glycosyl transferase family 1 [Alteromonas sp. Nap_26]